MNDTGRDIPRLIDRIYASALRDEDWPATLAVLSDHLHAAGGWIFELNRGNSQIDKWIAHEIEKTATEWVERVKSIDPRLKFTFSHPAGEIDYDARFITEREMDRHEFYDWQRKGQGTRYFIGSRLRDTPDRSSFFAFMFTPRHGPVSAQQIEDFARLSRHVDNAWRLSGRSGMEAIDTAMPAFINEHIPWGVVTLDADGCILAMNGRANRVIARRDGLGVTNHRLTALHPSENQALQSVIAEVLKSSAQTLPHPGGALRIARSSGLPGYVVQILPYVRNAAEVVPRVVVYVADPAAPHDLDPNSLNSAFHLTAREADLAILLANGATLAQAADRLKISYNTARIHLQNIFRKTSTSNQSGLVRLLAQMIGH